MGIFDIFRPKKGKQADTQPPAVAHAGQYTLLGLLDKRATVTLMQVADLLRNRFLDDPEVVVCFNPDEGCGEHLTVGRRRWAFHLTMSGEPHVLAESAQIADAYAVGRPDRASIAGCARRIEVTADADPNSEHIRDWFDVCHVLGSIFGLFLFCCARRTFWDEDGGMPLGLQSTR